MAKVKKKKDKRKSRKPVTDIKLAAKDKARIIHELHGINKEKHTVAKNATLSKTEKRAKCELLDEKLNKLGGLEAYQVVSKRTESHYGKFNTAKWVTQQLKAYDVLAKEGPRVELLDVGALSLNYTQHRSQIEATAIDLNPQQPGILKADLLTYRDGDAGVYDVVVMSLVLNFAGNPATRGDLLKRAAELCKLGGHLVIVLPLACVVNSRYMTEEHLTEMTSSLGFVALSRHQSRKLSFLMLRKNNDVTQKSTFPKTLLRNGLKMNNFCIVLR